MLAELQQTRTAIDRAIGLWSIFGAAQEVRWSPWPSSRSTYTDGRRDFSRPITTTWPVALSGRGHARLEGQSFNRLQDQIGALTPIEIDDLLRQRGIVYVRHVVCTISTTVSSLDLDAVAMTVAP